MLLGITLLLLAQVGLSVGALHKGIGSLSTTNYDFIIAGAWTIPADHHNTTGQFNPAFHGFNGILSVSLAGSPEGINSRVIQTTEELGNDFPFNKDMNSGKPLGVGMSVSNPRSLAPHIVTGWLQATIKQANRRSSATSYLAYHILNRPNLDVVVGTQVTRIVDTRAQKGTPDLRTVEVAESSTCTRPNFFPFIIFLNVVTLTAARIRLVASKELILSLGVIGTPHVLLNSGIGDESELRAFDIPPVLNLPGVGKNFTEMPAIPNYWRVNSTDTFDDIQRDSAVKDRYLRQWEVNQTGPLVSTTASHLIYKRLPENSTIFKNVTDPSSSIAAPHYEIFTVNGAFGASPPHGYYVSLVCIIVNPTSRTLHFKVLLKSVLTLRIGGSVTLNSSNPFVQPLIDPAVLNSEFDRFAMQESIRASSRFLAADAWKDYVIGPTAGLENVTNDEELDSYITQTAVIALHGVGTAAMTAKDASYGVVNPDLRLKGASGLRIVDASIFVRLSHCVAFDPVLTSFGSHISQQRTFKHPFILLQRELQI
ncbi:hypothetical protein C0991_010127 [Blastosporella zonata]|nr:hypothetical protein C0991_010127 [Blastosporella zonata]